MPERPSQAGLPGFEYEEEAENAALTARAGVPLLAQTFRGLGARSVAEQVRIKQRERGLSDAEYVESFVILNAVGGECLEDFVPLREDGAMAELIGHAMPSPEAARKFLYGFHRDEEGAEQLGLAGVARLRGENGPLRGLEAANWALIAEAARRSPSQRITTVDLDATVIESHKRGVPGYQPLPALWVEMWQFKGAHDTPRRRQ